jgi:hypothetical protein
VAFYPLDGDTKDKSGYNRHATAYGATPVTLGYQGGAYNFNGTSDYLLAPVNINPANYPELTMGAWVKPAATSPPRLVLTHDFGGFARSLGIDDRGGGTGWSAFCGTDGVLGFVPAVANQWTFLAVAYNQASKTIKLWVNDLNPIYGGGRAGSGARFSGHRRAPLANGLFSGSHRQCLCIQ